MLKTNATARAGEDQGVYFSCDVQFYFIFPFLFFASIKDLCTDSLADRRCRWETRCISFSPLMGYYLVYPAGTASLSLSNLFVMGLESSFRFSL